MRSKGKTTKGERLRTIGLDIISELKIQADIKNTEKESSSYCII